jgi:enoyl-CoA hydratase
MIHAETLPGARRLRLEHGRANALDLELLRALDVALGDAERDGTPALILASAGGIFSAGVDLRRLVAEDEAYLRAFLPALSDVMVRLFRYPGPVVAAIGGHAIAGGAILAFACDRRLMARGPGRIGVPELRVGVPFPPAVVEIVRFALPPARAQEAMLTGATWAPDDALRHGIVDALAEPGELADRAHEEATRLAKVPAASFRPAKELLRAPFVERILRMRAERDRSIEDAWASPEVRAAVRDYVHRTLSR